jgi:hypothetical protein
MAKAVVASRARISSPFTALPVGSVRSITYVDPPALVVAYRCLAHDLNRRVPAWEVERIGDVGEDLLERAFDAHAGLEADHAATSSGTVWTSCRSARRTSVSGSCATRYTVGFSATKARTRSW